MSVITPGSFGVSTIETPDGLIPAVLTSDGLVTLPDLLGPSAPSSVRGMLDDWDSWCDRIAAALASGVEAWTPPGDATFSAPLPDPSNLYLAGANYYDHIEEMGSPAPDKQVDEVFHFMVPTGSLVGTGQDVLRPKGVDELDWEVELAVVIGRRAEGVSAEHALDHVAGYTVANDVSVRGAAMFHPIFGLKFLYAKGQATLTPMGPAIVPARFVANPDALTLSTHVNGVSRQDASTAGMIWSVREQIAFLSSRAPLLPGDVILTGTPAGTAAAHGTSLADGDVMSMSVEGLGDLVNRVVATRS